jgi:DNA-binding beta-propeller fold protein YncE
MGARFMTDISRESGLLALSPLKIPGSKPGVKSEDPKVLDPVGVPLVLTAGRHLKVVADPPYPEADSLELHHNGVRITVPFTVDPNTQRTTFEVPRARLREGAHAFHYVTKRFSDNDETSPTQWVLYNESLPGGDDPINDGKDVHEGLGIKLPEYVIQNGVDLVTAGPGVPLAVTYANIRLHDVVIVTARNGDNYFEYEYTVVQKDLVGGAFNILLPIAFFMGAGNGNAVGISYTVYDQLENPTQNSLPSPSLSIKVDLTPKVELPTAPFVPGLEGKVIIPIKYTTGFVVRVDWAKGFKPGDKAKLVVKGGAAGAGTPVFTFVALNSNFRANFQLTTAFILANAGREVVFTWILLSGGVETESEPLTLTIESVNVTDPNFPKPEIVEAYGTNAVDLRAFTDDAHIVCAPWPLIGLLQKIWVHVLGTGKDGNPKTVAIAVGKTLTPEQVQKGLEYVLLRKDLELFAPGKELRVRLQVDFYPNEVDGTKKTFTLARYTLVTAGMKATLEFLNAPYRIAPMGHLTGIKLKLVDENGEFIKEKSVYVTIPSNFKYPDGTTGRREFKTGLFGVLEILGVTGADAPGTTYIIKAEYDGNVVTAKLDVTSRGKTGEMDFGFTTNGIAPAWQFGSVAISPDGTKILVSKPHPSNGFLAVIDAATLQMVGARIENLGMNYFAIAPDSDQVFMSSSYGYYHSAMSLSSGEQARIETTGFNSGECVFNLEGTHAYTLFTHGMTKTDIALKRDKSTGLPEANLIVMAPDGKTIFTFRTYGSELFSISTSSDSLIKRAKLPWHAHSLAISPDGKHIYANDYNAQKIMVIDSTSLLVIHTVDVIQPGVITLSPDGRLLYFSSEGSKVKALDTVNRKEVKTFVVAGDPCSLTLSLDSSRLLVVYKNKSIITVIQVE